MFEVLFTRPTVLARYREGPLSEARERFLVECAARGYSRSMLQKIAWVQLAVAHRLDLDHGKLTTRDLELAVDGRARFRRLPQSRYDSHGSRRLFMQIATEWVLSLGSLEPPSEGEHAFAGQIAAFARHEREDRGLSSVTIATRCERLHWFFDSLHPPRQSLRTITIADVDTFVETKGQHGWTRASLASLASSLRSFFHYAEGQGWCAPGLAAVVDSPRIYTREGLPQGPRWEDVQHLLNYTGGDGRAQIRNHAILMLLAVYGLRRGEVAQLTLDDLDWVGERVRISRPKQRRAQWYPLLPTVGEAILRYLRVGRPQCAHRALFLALSAPLRPLSPASITAIAHARLSALGVTVSPRGAHCLRHACAKHLLEAGFSLKQIGDYLGHRAATSTLSYTKVNLAGLRQVAELDLGRLL